jgi:TonB family protein
MSYQALLFCPDEKTARVVSQVLSELEFRVEPCNEPFAAVKKLMAQQYDAIVVDCDNEQNAALLFKSARNSGSNQASLAVAVVEGQAGVAKAFRIGANLVLTKPIHVEQSKGTLRVARGLLRKGQAAKPAGAAASAAEAIVAQPPSFSTPPSASAASAPFPAPHSSTPPPMASASAFELDAEPTPQPDAAEATLLEYMPDSAPSGAENSPHSAADSGQSKQYPWQPRSKPQAEPMASALRRAAEVAGKSEAPAPSQAAPPQAKTGAAAAPARAKEVPTSNANAMGLKPPVKMAPPRSKPEIAKSQEPEVAEAWGSNSASPAGEVVRFSSLGENLEQQASGAGGSKKLLLLAVVVLGVAAAGYFGWTKMHSAPPLPAVQSVAPASLGTAALPPQPAASVPESQPAATEVAEPQMEQPEGTPGPSSKPSAAVVADVPKIKTSAPAKAPTVAAPTDANDVTITNLPAPAKPEPAQPLLVKNGSSARAKTGAEVQEPEPAPAPTSITTGANSTVLSGLVNTNSLNVPKAPEQTLKLSQGVSQGLIIKKVQPIYPAQAMQMRLEGKVELQANISKSGSITGIKQLSGDGILGRAAIDAVRQWKYKPYFLNGEPIEIQTQITVNFKLP